MNCLRGASQEDIVVETVLGAFMLPAFCIKGKKLPSKRCDIKEGVLETIVDGNATVWAGRLFAMLVTHMVGLVWLCVSAALSCYNNHCEAAVARFGVRKTVPVCSET